MARRARFFGAFASRPRPRETEILRPAVSHGGDQVRSLLAGKTSTELAAADLRTVVEGNLWMLTPEAFRYFLPAFLHASLESYASLSVFVSELVGALTEPSREDVEEALEETARISSAIRLPAETVDQLLQQQREWFDSGTPAALFHERFDDLTLAEGAAVLAFFQALEEAHGGDFPFGELRTAVERHWGRYRASG